MTIRKGSGWGEPGRLLAGAPVVDDDAALGTLVNTTLRDALMTGEPVEVGLTGGDLHRTLGSPRHGEEDLREGRGMRFPVDVVVARLNDERDVIFVAHLVAGSRRAGLWAGRTVAMMNAAFIGEQNLGPRAHPGDGLLDVTDGALTFPQRRLARRRAVSGSHLPHPDLEHRRSGTHLVESERPLWIRADGRDMGMARLIDATVLPDALTIVV